MNRRVARKVMARCVTIARRDLDAACPYTRAQFDVAFRRDPVGANRLRAIYDPGAAAEGERMRVFESMRGLRARANAARFAELEDPS